MCLLATAAPKDMAVSVDADVLQLYPPDSIRPPPPLADVLQLYSTDCMKPPPSDSLSAEVSHPSYAEVSREIRQEGAMDDAVLLDATPLVTMQPDCGPVSSSRLEFLLADDCDWPSPVSVLEAATESVVLRQTRA